MEERERKERVPFPFLSRSRFFPFLAWHISTVHYLYCNKFQCHKECMVIENPPMARKGDDHVCIGLGCFLLVFPFFSFLFLEILFNECVLLALLQLL